MCGLRPNLPHRLEVGCPLAVVGVLYFQRDGDMGLEGDGGVGVDHNLRRLIVGDVGGVHRFRGAAARGR
jgi:hypothetical protein